MLHPTPKVGINRKEILLTPPTAEPGSLREFKQHIRQSHDDDDELLANMLIQTRFYLEEQYSIAFLSQSWELHLDSWGNRKPVPWQGTREGHIGMLDSADPIVLPRYPLQSVTSIATYAADGTESLATLATLIDTDVASKPGKINLKSGQTWPTFTRPYDGIKIIYVAGYSSASAIPKLYLRALYDAAAYLYTHRGDGCSMKEAARNSGAESSLGNLVQVRV